MKCPSCSTELPDTAKFCPECGTKIVRKTFCPECGTEVAPGTKFCPECGFKLAAATQAAPKFSSAPSPMSENAQKIARENAALAARPAPEVHPYEPAEPNRDYAKAQGNFFNENIGPIYIREQVLRIANAEGPITEGLLLVRVLDEWGLSGETRRGLRAFRAGIPSGLPVTDRLGEPVFWPRGSHPDAWNRYRVPGTSPRSRRRFQHIPLEEIAAAILAEHRASSGDLPLDDYIPGALERLGLSGTISEDMREALEVAKLLAQGIDNRPPVELD